MTLFINFFYSLIQEEKQSTEARAEELESRVGSIEHMNLLVRGRPSDKQSPELSGRSSPSSPNRDFMKYGVGYIIFKISHIYNYYFSIN